MSDKMRESFEQWVMSRALDLRMDKDAWGKDRYYHSHIDAMWTAWQAAHAAALPPGFVAVPVEATPKMQAEACQDRGKRHRKDLLEHMARDID